MLLGIEIGGTKLQLGVGDGTRAELVELVRADVQPERGAAEILRQILQLGERLVRAHRVTRIGFGFGGPVDAAAGRVIRSHHVNGWENCHLTQWCREQLGTPAVLGNDCDVAALAETHFGSGLGRQSVLFLTVGTGVGGGYVQRGQLLGTGRPAACEIGHLRPGLLAVEADQTVESLASGWGIAAAAQARLSGAVTGACRAWEAHAGPENRVERQRRLADATHADRASLDDLRRRCGGNPDHLTAQLVAVAAADGNEVAQRVLDHACRVLGWAIAQAVTLLAPEVVVVGGGVALMGEQQFFAPLRREVARYVFPPLRETFIIEPAALGEAVVVHGALYLAAHADPSPA